jgi:hypothetical protein
MTEHGLTTRFALCAAVIFQVNAARAEDLKTESRLPHLHDIPLHDSQGRVISPPAILSDDGKPQDPKAAPYSPAQTCGKCHDYATISQGWHFNEALGNVKPGRPGEPWILTDFATHTQIPISYRSWTGTFKPSELGLTDYDFLTNFARHFPGGGVGEPAKIDPSDAKMGRLQITGTLEIDCLLCHQSTGAYDHEARFTALRRENLRWAPTIGAGLGSFASFRSAGSIADQWHPGKPVPSAIPAIKYDRAKFGPDNNVLLQLTRKPASAACFYCHTSESSLGDSRWHSDPDVHLRAGLNCADCHRNGIDHMIVRGYEGESKDRSVTQAMIDTRAELLERDDDALGEAAAKDLARKQLGSELEALDTLSCKGCHTSGRLGAPPMVHKGLPLVHFERLACTACHSGPMPASKPEIVHTSLAHKLGLPAPARGKRTAPVILEPVFLYGPNGKIAPYRMVWPSYWARRKSGKLQPILPAEVLKSANLPKQEPDAVQRDPYNTRPLTDAQIQTALDSLSKDATNGEPVFIAAGKLYRMQKGILMSEEDAAAQPYSWALAHDVRPARQALGAKGCADCHSEKSPMFFGNVLAQGPVEPGKGLARETWQLLGEDKRLASVFAFTFHFRPWLKLFILVMALIVAGVLAHYFLRAMGLVTVRADQRKS